MSHNIVVLHVERCYCSYYHLHSLLVTNFNVASCGNMLCRVDPSCTFSSKLSLFYHLRHNLPCITMIVIGQFSCTKSAGKMVGKCVLDLRQIIKTGNGGQELWMSSVKNWSNYVPQRKFLYKLMVEPPLFLQSNPLSHVNLLVSFAWFWPSSSVDNPKTRAAIPRFLRKFSASTILFALMTQNTPLTNRNVEFSKWAATRNIKICCMISWERRW